MKTWMGMLLAAVVGGGVAVIGVKFLQDDSLPVVSGGVQEAGSAAARLVSSNPPPKAALAPLAIPRRPIFQRSGIVLSRPPAAKPGAAVQDAEIQAILTEADRFFSRGEEVQGLRLYRAAFSKAQSRKDVNLTSQVLKLLKADDNLTLWREKYINYLVERGEGNKAFENQLSRGNSILLQGKEELLPSAWAELSQAHRLATNEILRTRVYDIVAPMLQRNVFSLRMSPLVERYNVQPGDNLTRIARQYQTTPAAISRLSGLSSEVIQPRSRLRILGGKMMVFIDKSDFLLWVTLDGKLLYQARVGLGRDNTTPEGQFVIEVLQKNPTWFRPGSDPVGPGDPRNVLGSRWLGFRDTAQVSGIGIHGTLEENSIGRESSAGCIRMHKEDVEMVFDLLPRGTVVEITP